MEMNDEQILKVFNNITLEELHRQKDSAVEVFKAMVPTAISFEMVRAGDKYGIVYEFLNSTSAGKLIADHPEKIQEVGEKMGQLLRDTHDASMKHRSLFLPILRMRKNRFIRDLGFLKSESDS